MKKLNLFSIIALIQIILLVPSAIAQLKTEPLTFGYSFTLNSKVLQEDRTIMIFLPDNYASNQKKYPVCYLTDGQWHFAHTVQAVNMLAGNKIIPKMILVGVVTQANRSRDLSPSCNGQNQIDSCSNNFYKFLTEELIPYVDKNYRTVPYRILDGTSLGGLFAMYALTTNPKLFNSYLAISPSMWWNNRMMIKTTGDFLLKNPNLQNYLYITLANEGIGMGVTALVETLKQSAPKGLIWKFDEYPEEIHETTSYKSTYNGLKFIFKDWSPKLKIETKGELITPGDSIQVKITSQNKTIRYTLDGSHPTINSSLYEKPFVINKPLTLKAVPFDNYGIQGNEDSIVCNFNPGKKCKPAPAGITVQSVLNKYIEALGGTANLSKIKDLTIKSSVEVQGTKLNACITCKIPDKSITDVTDMVGNTVQKTVINGETGKKINGNLQGEELNKAKIESNIFFPLFNYEKIGYQPELKGITEIDGKEVYLIVLYSSWNSLISEYYSVESGLKIKLETTLGTPRGRINETTEMLEYITSNGIKFPKTVKIKQSADPQLIEVFVNSIEVNTGIKDDIFN